MKPHTQILDNIKSKQRKDQFKPYTRAVRRNLLMITSTALFISMDGHDFTTFLSLNLADELTLSRAKGLVSSVVIIELIFFIFYAKTDHSEWKLDSYREFHDYNTEHLTIIKGHILDHENRIQTAQTREQQNRDGVPVSDVISILERIDKASIDIAQCANDSAEIIRKKTKRINIYKWIRIYIIDWTVPIVGAVVVFIINHTHIYTSLVSFLKLLIP